MAKWPAVPHVYGWLRLDRRGDWLIKEERIANSGVTAFIGRNYGVDERGAGFFRMAHSVFSLRLNTRHLWSALRSTHRYPLRRILANRSENCQARGSMKPVRCCCAGAVESVSWTTATYQGFSACSPTCTAIQ